MKLLEKAQIATLKSSERKQELDEGLKLARKIDKLRETAAQEETNLSKFRESSLKGIREEISGLTARRDFLENQIKELEKSKKALQIPLDKEWDKVKKMREEITQLGVDLEARKFSLTNQEQDLQKEKHQAFESKQKALDYERLTLHSLKKAQENEQNTERILRETEEKREEMLARMATKTQEITEREARIAIREREVNLVTAHNEETAKLLGLREKQLNDRYATLERTLARINNK